MFLLMIVLPSVFRIRRWSLTNNFERFSSAFHSQNAKSKTSHVWNQFVGVWCALNYLCMARVDKKKTCLIYLLGMLYARNVYLTTQAVRSRTNLGLIKRQTRILQVRMLGVCIQFLILCFFMSFFIVWKFSKHILC